MPLNTCPASWLSQKNIFKTLPPSTGFVVMVFFLSFGPIGIIIILMQNALKREKEKNPSPIQTDLFPERCSILYV